MKKFLLASVAVGALAVATPSFADDHGIKVDVGGVFKGYAVYNDQDNSEQDSREIDILRETEIHFNGEKTLDNGLTVGLHFETDLDQTDADNFNTEESYVYFSGDWGRVNFGKEDGAAYLLQVAVPSADSNVDGLRQFVQPINDTALTTDGQEIGSLRLDYDQNISDYANKLTYITPVFEGFQAGISYTPEADDNDEATRGTDGVNLDDQINDLGEVIDLAVRYEGQFDKLGVTLGAGYTTADVEEEAAVLGAGDLTSDREAFNLAADFDWGPFGFGVSYSEDDNGDGFISATDEIDEEEKLVIGADYTHGPYKLGLSYFDGDNIYGVEDLEVERYTGGIVYTYGPGMTFRGSISYVDYDDDAVGSTRFDGDDSADSTSVLVGTQIKF